MCCVVLTCSCLSLFGLLTALILSMLTPFIASTAAVAWAFYVNWNLEPLNVQAVPIAEVEKTLALAPESYPDALRGMLWMDQTGSLAHSDIPLAAPDLALSFGDTSLGVLDPAARRISVNVVGSGWQWMNNMEAYLGVRMIRLLGFHYVFEFNEDYTFAQIYPTVTLGPLGTVSMPHQLMSFTMVKQKHEPGQCPPAPDAPKEKWTACAEWDRVSSGLFSPLFGKYGVLHYYVFKIVDAQGNQIQPYYDAYLRFAKASINPAPTQAKQMSVGIAEGAESFVVGSAEARSTSQKQVPKAAGAEEL